MVGVFALISIINNVGSEGRPGHPSIACYTSETDQRDAATSNLSKDKECMRNAKCAIYKTSWTASADVYCHSHIENYAKYDYDWTDGWAESKFDRIVVQANCEAIQYMDSSLKFQNGFGAWQRMGFYPAR